MSDWSFQVKEIINENTLPIIFEQSWYQEDITELRDTVLGKIKNITIIEHATGADRESIRISHESAFFNLNFEFYSQSCWLEAGSISDNEGLISLYTSLS